MIHVCVFTSLDELPRKLHGDADAVCAALKKAGRFSAFDINTQQLATTITRLFKSGRIKDVGGAYPWTNVEVRL